MALSKKDAEKLLKNREEICEYDNIETRIDEAIFSHYRSYKGGKLKKVSVVISGQLFDPVELAGSELKLHLKKLYERRGWKVSFHNQRTTYVVEFTGYRSDPHTTMFLS